MSFTHPIRALRVVSSALLGLTAFAACEQTPLSPDSIEQAPVSRTESLESLSPVIDLGPANHDDSFRPSGSALVLAGGKFVVDDDGAQCPKADYVTIQAAVDAAALDPGKNKIEICAGTYPEDVYVGPGNSLDIKGDGIDVTTITGVPGSGAPVVHIVNAGEVKIERLTVDGQMNRHAGGASVYGIRFEDTDADVKEVRVANISNAAKSNQGNALGVLVYGTGSYKAKVHKSVFENFSRGGILVDADSNVDGIGGFVDAEVKDNLVIGPGETTGWAPNGIQISRGASGKVQKNQISGADHTCQCASGIILFQAAAGVQVKDNEISSSDIGVAVLETDGVDIHKNDVEGGDSDGIRAAVSNDSRIKDNHVTGAGDDGVQVSNGSTGVEVEKNEAHDSVGDGYVATSSTSGNVFKKNVATGSGSFSCNDTSAGGGTAGTANAWEKNEGQQPSNPPGICD